MENTNRGNMILYVLIVVAVIGFLVYITSKGQVSVPAGSQAGQVGGAMNDMENAQNGVEINITKEGTGDVAKTGDMVSMNYTGRLEDGTVFDSNVDPKFGHVEPFVFTLGAGQVIKGWDVGIAGMKVGEKRTISIKPELAYGTTGAGGIIPPNATLVFDVELTAINR